MRTLLLLLGALAVAAMAAPTPEPNEDIVPAAIPIIGGKPVLGGGDSPFDLEGKD